MRAHEAVSAKWESHVLKTLVMKTVFFLKRVGRKHGHKGGAPRQLVGCRAGVFESTVQLD